MLNRKFVRILSLILTLSLLTLFVSCNTDDPSKDPNQTEGFTIYESGEGDTVPPTQDGGNKEPDKSQDGRLRVLLVSDVHFTHARGYFDRTPEERAQKLINDILAEHEKSPIDLIVFVGDLSLDHWATNGTWTTSKISDTKQFVDDYVSQLPDSIPVFVLPGNHEQYNNMQWKLITGHDRQTSYAVEGNLFIMLDNFRETLEPNYKDYSAPDSVVDTAYIKQQMALYPDHNVWLISHYFHLPIQTDEFKQILCDDRVKGLFQGHTHLNTFETLKPEYGSKIVATCGSYAEPGGTMQTEEDLQEKFWGFRELNITPQAATSYYIVTETTLKMAQINFHITYKKNNLAIFYRA